MASASKAAVVGGGALSGALVSAVKKAKGATTLESHNGIHPKNLKHGYIVNEDSGEKLKFQYNPESFYTEFKVLYEEVESPGAHNRMLSYEGRQLVRFPLTLHFYGWKNVVGKKSSSEIEHFFRTLIRAKQKQKKLIKGTNHFISPPVCTLVFGSKCWETVVENLKLTRHAFNPKLKTLQLEVNISFIVLRKSNKY